LVKNQQILVSQTLTWSIDRSHICVDIATTASLHLVASAVTNDSHARTMSAFTAPAARVGAPRGLGNTGRSIAPRLVSPPVSRRHTRAHRVSAIPEPAPVAPISIADIKELSYDWQLDFCSRPMKDERGKKMWELLICDETRSFEHAEFFPNNRINSVELSKAIERVIQAQGSKPRRFKFFRSQMQTIITRACNDAGIQPLASRRCQTLTSWLDDRVENVYKKHPGFDGAYFPLPRSASLTDFPYETDTFFFIGPGQASPMMGFEASSPRPLPDALRGESWAFVALPLAGVRDEIEQVKKNKVFGDVLAIDPNTPDDTLIPGIAVYTARAAALSGWTKGLELGGISVDLDMGTLILDTGVADSWQYARFKQTEELTQEAREWEQVKAATGGLHFLAIQTDEDAEQTDGFWILQDFTAAKY
jgi:hypothetical protein|tara:strand:+ start:4639 stop:5898 length:1260 start_codon:yes stop_codon:yes gene_type:complete